MDDKKNKVLLTVIGAMTFIAALVGATYAYFSATSTTEEPVKITTSNTNLSVEADGDALHVNNIKPTKWNDEVKTDDEKYVDIAKIPFKVTGTSNVAGTYKINMKTSISLGSLGTGGKASDIKYRVYSVTEPETVGDIIGSEGSFDVSTDTDILTEISFDGTSDGGVINDEYVMYVYIDESSSEQNQLQNVDFTITLGGSATASPAA